MDHSTHFREIQRTCNGITDPVNARTRDLMSRVADKWSLWTMGVLAQAGKPMRFSRIWEAVGDISQKSLTNTLRQLERDGLLTRKMYMELPPRVEYDLTPLGIEMLKQVEPLWFWLAEHVSSFEAAQASFDSVPNGYPAEG